MRRAVLAVGAVVSAVLAIPVLATAPPPASASALTVGSTYVALGDSYSSAPGVPYYVSGTRCSRSTQDYAHLTAADLGLALTDTTCSGAASRHLTEPQYDSNGTLVQGPQLDALTPDAALVTLGMGGNDGDYFWDMLVGWQMAGGDAAAADLIRTDVVQDVARIRAIAPQARVVVVGYPGLYPAQGWCDELLLPAEQVPLAYARNKALADAVRTGAAQAGTDFIEMFDRSSGHDICSADPWMLGKTGAAGVATPFHPRVVEQQVVRDALTELIGPVAPAPSSATASAAPVQTPTPTPTAAPSASDTPTATATATATATPTASATATSTAAEAATATPEATATPAASASETPIATTSPAATPEASQSATPAATPTATTTATPTGASAVPAQGTAAPAMPTVTWYAQQGRPLVRRVVGVPLPSCSPAVCWADYRWQIDGVTVGAGQALYLRRAWRGHHVSVLVTVHAYGMAWTRTYRWLRAIHYG